MNPECSGCSPISSRLEARSPLPQDPSDATRVPIRMFYCTQRFFPGRGLEDSLPESPSKVQPCGQTTARTANSMAGTYPIRTFFKARFAFLQQVDSLSSLLIDIQVKLLSISAR